MPKNKDQIVVGANGEVHVAPKGTPLPANSNSALDAEFKDLGFTSEAGVKLTDTKTVKHYRVWQSFYPARTIVEAREFDVVFNLAQWAKANVELAYGATVTDLGGGEHKIEPPDPESLSEKVLVVDWRDGTKRYRLVVDQTIVSDSVESTVARSDPAELPIKLSALGVDGTKPWRILTNDPALA